MCAKIETARTDRFSMDYFRFGNGEKTLVIIPGLNIQSVMRIARTVEKEYEIMKDGFTVYLFDRRKEVPASYTVREMAWDTAEAIRSLGLSEICLYGTSQGGMIAQLLAAENPDLVKKLVLGCTSANVRDDDFGIFDNWIRLAKERDGVGLYKDSSEKIYPREVYERNLTAIELAGKTVTEEEFARFITFTEGMRGFCSLFELDRIVCPVLLIGARDDAVLGYRATEEIAERLIAAPELQMQVYDGYGHVSYDLAPDCRERILKFLN